ncbi:PAS domain S-box protein [Azohydromonas caseinilytica]|uniref:histidine kinase n=1 Tax=Azohydromonas caseinilytica TaxID=2728836 RepID=A0A848FDY4_9BURK|nr:PAS domain S-box protein [Azohydromonas caseinilytica]NML17654.1 PAS domain S-box protein [Azohydromonas caseinilytica]
MSIHRVETSAPGPDAGSLYRSLFMASPDALLLVDVAGRIVLASPAAERLLGYAPDMLVGLSVDALVPDGIRPRHAAYRAGYAHHPRPRPMGVQQELVALRRDGTQVRVEIALSPLHGQGLPYVLAAVRDVGDYPRVRQALQRARYSETVAQLSRLAVDALDPRPLLERVPLAAAQALESDEAAVLLLEPDGQHLRIAGCRGTLAGVGADPDGCLPLDAEAQLVLARGEPLSVSDYAREKRFAVPLALLDAGRASALAVPLLDRGRAIGLLQVRCAQPGRFGEDELHFLQSLSNLLASSLQRAQGEEALRHAQRLESVGQLTGGIAHDFNNLLTVIHGNLQVLQELPSMAGDACAQQLLASALRASRRGAELTAKLLAFSRRQVLQPRPVDVPQLLASLTDMLRRTLDPRIEIALDAPSCPRVLVDPGQLESALLNIAINARDAMPEGGRLAFRCRARDRLPPGPARKAAPPAAGSYVAISVSDTGVGMPEAVRERAFEPFFTTKETGRGTGLGLSTVYGFATQSHGTVTLDSAPGAGTTVTLFLPHAEADAPQALAADPAAASLPPGLHVLLVEDDAEVSEVLRGFLAGFGCRVTACASGEQALAGPEPAQGFDLLLSDVALGAGMRGTELARRATARWSDLAVLLISGYPEELAGPRGSAQRPWPLLHKPCSRKQLLRALVRALGPG